MSYLGDWGSWVRIPPLRPKSEWCRRLPELRSRQLATVRQPLHDIGTSRFTGVFPNEQVASFALAYCAEDERAGRDMACAAAQNTNMFGGSTDILTAGMVVLVEPAVLFAPGRSRIAAHR